MNSATPIVRITLTDVTSHANRPRRNCGLPQPLRDPGLHRHRRREQANLRVNKAFCRVTGYSGDEALRLTFFNGKRHDTDFFKGLWASLANDGSWRGELWENRKNGEPLLMAINITAVKDDQGRVTHYVADFIDITDHRKKEEQIRIAAAAFKAQESIMVTDSNRVILRVNEAFTRITGYSTEEAVGKTPRILRSGFHDKAFYDAVLETVAMDGYWEGEIWNKRKNGEIFPVLQTISAVKDAAGQLTHFVGIMLDITVQKHAEKVLLEVREHLESQVATTQEELEGHQIPNPRSQYGTQRVAQASGKRQRRGPNLIVKPS